MSSQYCVTIFVKGWPNGEEVYGPYASDIEARKVQTRLIQDALRIGFERRAIRCAVRVLYQV